MKPRWLFPLAMAAAACPATALAQVYMPTFETSTILLDVYSYSFPSGDGEERNGDIPQRGAAFDGSYTPSPAVTLRVHERFVDFIGRQAGEAGAQEMRQVLATQDAVGSWLQVVGGDGLVRDDLVDSITAYWVLNWNVANQTDSNRAQMQAAREQVRGAVAANSALASLDESGRQEMSEALILNFLVQHAAFRDAAQAGNRELMQQLSDAATARFRNEAGLDLRTLDLTPEGFTTK